MRSSSNPPASTGIPRKTGQLSTLSPALFTERDVQHVCDRPSSVSDSQRMAIARQFDSTAITRPYESRAAIDGHLSEVPISPALSVNRALSNDVDHGVPDPLLLPGKQVVAPTCARCILPLGRIVRCAARTPGTVCVSVPVLGFFRRCPAGHTVVPTASALFPRSGGRHRALSTAMVGAASINAGVAIAAPTQPGDTTPDRSYWTAPR